MSPAWTSSGSRRAEAGMVRHSPKSTPRSSQRTIHRRYMHRRLHAAPRSTEERCFSQRGAWSAAKKFAAEIGEDRRKVAHGGVAALEKGPDAAVERFDAAQGQHEIAGVAPR